jgi:hypothetical protein
MDFEQAKKIGFAQAKKIISKAKEAGRFCEIRAGIFLASAETMIAEQETWCDEDESKEFDFTVAAYWVTTDTGDEPYGVDTVYELVELFE